MTPTQYLVAKRMWAEGMTAKAIAARLGMPVTTINGVVHKHRDDFPRRIRHRIPDEERARIRELRAQGVTQRKVAETMGVHVNTVARIEREP